MPSILIVILNTSDKYKALENENVCPKPEGQFDTFNEQDSQFHFKVRGYTSTPLSQLHRGRGKKSNGLHPSAPTPPAGTFPYPQSSILSFHMNVCNKFR